MTRYNESRVWWAAVVSFILSGGCAPHHLTLAYKVECNRCCESEKETIITIEPPDKSYEMDNAE